eukprot:gene7220-327_t
MTPSHYDFTGFLRLQPTLIGASLTEASNCLSPVPCFTPAESTMNSPTYLVPVLLLLVASVDAGLMMKGTVMDRVSEKVDAAKAMADKKIAAVAAITAQVEEAIAMKASGFRVQGLADRVEATMAK